MIVTDHHVVSPATITCCYVLGLPLAELEKKLYDLKKFIKTLHETVPRADNAEDDQLASAEVPVWLSKDLGVKIRRVTLVSLAVEVWSVTSMAYPCTQPLLRQ